MIKKTEEHKTGLRAHSHSGSTEIEVKIMDGVVRRVVLRVDKHEGSSLPSEFSELVLPGGFRQLSIIAALSREMVDAIIAEGKE